MTEQRIISNSPQNQPVLISYHLNNLQGKRDILVSVILPLGISGGLNQELLPDLLEVCGSWEFQIEFIIVRGNDVGIEAPLKEFLLACRKTNISTSMFQVSTDLEWKSVMNIAFYQCHGDVVLAPKATRAGHIQICGSLHRQFWQLLERVQLHTHSPSRFQLTAIECCDDDQN